MTDILTRLAQRLSAPETALRPAPGSRFDPGAFDGPATLEEISEEQFARPAPQAWRETVAPDTEPRPAPTAPDLSSHPAHDEPIAQRHDAATTSTAATPPPTPRTLDTRTQDSIAAEPGREHREERQEATTAGSNTERVVEKQSELIHQGEVHIETRTIEHHTVERQSEAPQSPMAREPVSAEARENSQRPSSPTPREDTDPPPLRPVARRAPDTNKDRTTLAQERAAKDEPTQQAPVQVHIDRLEIRLNPPQSAAPVPKPTRPKALELEHFLADLEGRS